jgi:hypothetical protein
MNHFEICTIIDLESNVLELARAVAVKILARIKFHLLRIFFGLTNTL